jgi:hypothetical protein
MIWEAVKAPFDPAKVSWRVGSTTADKSKGLALAYIDARDVMERLDEVCGPDGWQDSYTETAKGRVLCTIRIKVGDEWIAKSDGAGNTDVEADKGGISDAFKRAAVKWGIGRYLYDVDSPWVELAKRGNSYAIAPNEMARLAKQLGAPPKPRQEAPPEPPKTEPPHVRDAKAIIVSAEKVAADEWEGFMDGLEPRLADIKKASENTYNFVMDRLGAIEAAMKVGS